MSNRFHSKYHRKNHHTYGNVTNPEASHDPIASPSHPFLGDFSLQGSLCAVAPASAFAGYFYSLNTALCAIGGNRGMYVAGLNSNSIGIQSYSLNIPLSTAYGKNLLHGTVGVNKNTITNGYVLDVLGNTNLDGNLNVVGDVDIDGGDLTASTATFNLLNTLPTTTINFGSQATTINMSKPDDSGVVNINSTREAESCSDAALVVDGGVGIGKDLYVCGNIIANNTDESTSCTTGALIVKGGAGIAKNLNVCGDLSVAGGDMTSTASTFNMLNSSPVSNINFGGGATTIDIGKVDATSVVNINGTKESTSCSNGALVVDGGVGIAKNLNVCGNATVNGDLTVLGEYTYLHTKVEVTSAVEIINNGTGPALKVTQSGTQPIAHFIDANGDDIVFNDNGFVGIGISTPTEKLTVMGRVSATGFRANQGVPSSADSSTNGYAFGGDGDTGLFSPIVGGGVSNGIISLYSNNVEVLRATSIEVNIYKNVVIDGTLKTDPTPPISKVSSFTIDNTYHDQTILVDSTDTVYITLPTGLAPGLQFSVIRANTGMVQFAGGAGATVLSTPDNTFNKLAFTNSVASAYYANNNKWYLLGDLLP